MADFDGLEMHLGNLARLSRAQTRSISPENVTGEKGKGGMSTDGAALAAAADLGQGWKVSPYIWVQAGETATLADIEGAGQIQHIWLTTVPRTWRQYILRVYWDGDERPAIEVPLGDFFCQGWNEFAQVSSMPIAVNSHGGFNCYWPMPFRKRARITLENRSREPFRVFYQITYALTDVRDDLAYLHAQWRRSNPLPYKEVHTLLDGIQGSGHYAGTYIAWGVNNNGWWGEGEIKFYMDGDLEYPTICGTGTEDYFGGAFNFDVPSQGYTTFTTPFLGLCQVLKPDGLYRAQQRFGMYRWHVMDPIRFAQDLRVTIQALGWRSGRRYLPLQDDIASTAFWYGQATSYPRPAMPDTDRLEVV